MTGAAASIQANRKPPELEDFYASKDADNVRVRKEYEDFRDRAAYVFVTGTFPTHLRTFFNALLRKATRFSHDASAMDKRAGRVATLPEVVTKLQLEQHPLVLKVREYVDDGWKIQAAKGVTDRRPYSKVFLFQEAGGNSRGIRKVTVQADGSVKEGWA